MSFYKLIAAFTPTEPTGPSRNAGLSQTETSNNLLKQGGRRPDMSRVRFKDPVSVLSADSERSVSPGSAPGPPVSLQKKKPRNNNNNSNISKFQFDPESESREMSREICYRR